MEMSSSSSSGGKGVGLRHAVPEEHDHEHGSPPAGMMCMCTWEEIDENSYVEYQVAPGGTWHPCLFGETAVRELRSTQYHDYIENVQKSDCIKEFTRLMKSGPPVWISDKHAMPLPREAKAAHVCALWFMSGNKTESAKLDGALEGEARQKLWDDMKNFMSTVQQRDSMKKEKAKQNKEGVDQERDGSKVENATPAVCMEERTEITTSQKGRKGSASTTTTSTVQSPQEELHDSSSPSGYIAEGGFNSRVNEDALSYLKWRYLVPMLLFRASNWLQGPYFYALYSNKTAVQELQHSYGGVTTLYISGYVASLTAGTFLGSLTDRFGRRNGCVLCGLAFIFTCLSVHSESILILLLGRITSGIGSTLLHSAFEAWLVGEASRLGPLNWHKVLVSPIISSQTTLNSGIAILSGIAATFAVDHFGITGASDLAFVFLICGIFLILFAWEENFGHRNVKLISESANGASSSEPSVATNPARRNVKRQETTLEAGSRTALRVLWAKPRLAVLGLVQVAYEGAMHLFITLWPEILERISATDESNAATEVELKSGVIFSGFMLCVTLGSSLFSLYIRRKSSSYFFACSALLFVGAASLLVPMYIKANFWATLASFFLFEVTAGAYHPCIGLLRTHMVPADVMASMITLFRVPQNIFVIFWLLFSKSGDPTSDETHVYMLGMCGYILIGAMTCLIATFGTGKLFAKQKLD